MLEERYVFCLSSSLREGLRRVFSCDRACEAAAACQPLHMSHAGAVPLLLVSLAGRYRNVILIARLPWVSVEVFSVV